jgi:hypothetical protein
MGSDTPHVIYGSQVDYKKLFFSDYDAALILPGQVQAGYGVLEKGTALARNLSAAGNAGKHVPYNPTTFDGTQDHPGRAYLVSSLSSGETSGEVSIEDSYKFAVGDDIIIVDDDAAVNGGAIGSIDRTTYTNRAVIAFTTAITDGSPTGDNAYACIEAGDNTNNYSDCVGILAAGVNTGIGKDARGAQAPILISNAIIYSGSLVNFDSAARTDLGSSDNGQFEVLK